jgi:hypothetical protein
MVQRVQYLIFDDLDGAEGAETILFGLDGTTYEIDLTPENAATLRETLEPWIKAGRRPKSQRPGVKPAKAAPPAEGETAKIRAWAREEGREVSDRGRIPAEIREAYQAAHR